jgi:hypothetical protein
MKIVSGEWTTNGRTVYTKVTDTRSRHPGGQQAILSIAEGWSDREASELCKRIAILPELLDALEELADLMDDVKSGDYTPDSFTCQAARRVLAAAKGDSHATPTD